MSLRIGAKNFVLMAHRLHRWTQILVNRFALAFRPDGVGADLCVGPSSNPRAHRSL